MILKMEGLGGNLLVWGAEGEGERMGFVGYMVLLLSSKCQFGERLQLISSPRAHRLK